MDSNWLQFAMAQTPGGASGSAAPASPASGLMSLLPLLLIFVLFYVMFILPQRKQQKEHQEMLKTLKKGDEVITNGGIYGTVTGFNDSENSVFLKVDDSVKIEIQRAAITGLRKSTLKSGSTPVLK